MENENNMQSVSRREALRVIGVGVVATSGVAACLQKPKKKTTKGGEAEESGAKAAEEAKAEAAKPAEPEKAEEAKPEPEKAPEAKAEEAGTKKADAKKAEETEAKKAEKAEAEKAEGAPEVADCTEGVEIDAASQQMRTALQYVPKTKKAGMQCSTCLQYKPPKDGGPCGGCKLFTGPVHATGYCLSYAPMKS